MTKFHEIRQDASDFELPGPNASVSIEFSYTNGHQSIKSIACCDAATPDVFDRQLDRLHTLKFGEGQWINAEKLSSSKRPREDDSDHLSVDERHAQLKKRLHDLPSSFASQPNAVKAAGQSIEESLTELRGLSASNSEQQKTIQKAIDQVGSAVSISRFVQNVLRGVETLRKSSKRPEQIPFVRLAEYCNSRASDDGTLLEELLENISLSISKTSERTISDYEMILNNIRIFRKSILYAADNKSILSDMPTSFWKRYEHLATVSSSKNSINKIVNALHEATEMGSFVVYAALEATCSKFSELRRVKTLDLPTVVPSAVEALVSSGIQEVPDHVTALHVPAVVAYLLDVDYAVVCHALHLPHLAGQDPGIASRLDQLAQQLTRLDTYAPDYLSQCLAIERRATNIMRISIRKRRLPILQAEKEHQIEIAVPDCSSNGSSHIQGGVRSVETPGMSAAFSIPALAANAISHGPGYEIAAVPISTQPSSLPGITHHGVLNPTLTATEGFSTGGQGYMDIMLENTRELEGLSELDNTSTFLDPVGIDMEFWNFASADLVQVMDINAFGQSGGFSIS
ncbi:hypothetical protein CcaCcLH18_07593 [Colletotrichum camelliae]|nr:hypothetical protein CcaCcLH18_07593 [Colletotrichum camelliae]